MAEMEKLKEEVEEIHAEQMEQKKIVEQKIEEPIDMSDIIRRLNHSNAVVMEINKDVKKDSYKRAAIVFKGKAAEITWKMKQREEDKIKAIAQAKLPIPEITFGDNLILMNGVPFDQASDAEQLRASLAIAMSLNPKLRVIRVRDGSLLDEDSMAIVSKMASDKDFQVWIEKVDGSGKVGFVLEDGMLKTKIGRKS